MCRVEPSVWFFVTAPTETTEVTYSLRWGHCGGRGENLLSEGPQSQCRTQSPWQENEEARD